VYFPAQGIASAFRVVRSGSSEHFRSERLPDLQIARAIVRA
jgi:hypothetical protein